MAACTDFTLKVDDSFSSFADLERAINHIQHTTAVQLWRRESKTRFTEEEVSWRAGEYGEGRPAILFTCILLCLAGSGSNQEALAIGYMHGMCII